MTPRVLVGVSVLALLAAACGSEDTETIEVPLGDVPTADEPVATTSDAGDAGEVEAPTETEVDAATETELEASTDADSEVPADTEADVPDDGDDLSESEVADIRRESLDAMVAEDIAISLQSGNEPVGAILPEEAQCAGSGLVAALGSDRLLDVGFADAFGPFVTPPIDLTIDEARIAADVIFGCLPTAFEQMLLESDLDPAVGRCAFDRMLADGLLQEGFAWQLVLGADGDLESVMPGSALAAQEIIDQCRTAE